MRTKPLVPGEIVHWKGTNVTGEIIRIVDAPGSFVEIRQYLVACSTTYQVDLHELVQATSKQRESWAKKKLRWMEVSPAR